MMSKLLYRGGRGVDPDPGGEDQDAAVGGAAEVGVAVDRAVVLPERPIELDPNARFVLLGVQPEEPDRAEAVGNKKEMGEESGRPRDRGVVGGVPIHIPISFIHVRMQRTQNEPHRARNG